MTENTKTSIIIADDNTTWCNLLKKYLEQRDYEIVGTTSDGEEQLEMIKTLRPNLVITDLKRDKGISGIEVIKRYNEQNIVKTKFLVETGCYYKDQMDVLEDMGIKHILFKPFVLDRIVEEIEEIKNEDEKNLVTINNCIIENKKSILELIKIKLMNIRINSRKD